MSFFQLLALALAPCAYEDSTHCYWNADVFGNGQGDSFISIDVPNGEFVLYENGDVLLVPTDGQEALAFFLEDME